MNTKNNKRKRESIFKIESAFMDLLQEKSIEHISVTEICEKTGLNRSTFYANYIDIYDLAGKIGKALEKEFSNTFSTLSEQNSLKVFRHIYENQQLYKTYFKLGFHERQLFSYEYDKKRAENDFDNKHLKYHIEFFRKGFNAIVKLWLEGGCIETPEEMQEVLQSEYRGR